MNQRNIRSTAILGNNVESFLLDRFHIIDQQIDLLFDLLGGEHRHEGSCHAPGRNMNAYSHTGISRVPWKGICRVPTMKSCTSLVWKTPLFFLDKTVRLAGFRFNSEATGPLPVPSLPWHEAQYCLNCCSPEPLSEEIVELPLVCASTVLE